MARSRNIKPGFFENDLLAEVDPLGRLLFAGLWTLADREGRLEDRSKRIKASLLPYDDCDVDALLDQLAVRGFIQRYSVDGNRLILVVNFRKHQNPHKDEKARGLPAPESTEAGIVGAPYSSDASKPPAREQPRSGPADSLNLITDPLNRFAPGHDAEVITTSVDVREHDDLTGGEAF